MSPKEQEDDDLSAPQLKDDAGAQKDDDDDEEDESWSTSSSNRLDSMLDVFPLSREELEHLLKCYATTQEKQKEVSWSTSSWSFHSLVQYTLLSSIEQKNEEEQARIQTHLERLQHAERHFLPEASRILQQSYEDAFVVGGDGEDAEEEDAACWKYLEAVSTLIGRRNCRSLHRILYQASGSMDTDTRQPQQLVDFTYRLILAVHFLETGSPSNIRPSPKAWVESLSQKCIAGGSVSESEWLNWVNSIAPQVHESLSTFCHCALFRPRHPFRPSNPPLRIPIVDQECGLWSETYQSIPSSIAIMSPQLGGRWIRRYSSDFDGFSFSTFQQSLLAFQGTTVILIQTTAGDAFGYYSSQPWKESKQWFGQGADSFLFGLKPTLQYYGPTSNGGKSSSYAMYLHNPAHQKNHPGYLYGLCVGGVADSSPRIHIPPSFEGCKAQSIDKAFEMGPLLSDHQLYFDIDAIEVWAVNMNQKEYNQAVKRGTFEAECREGLRVNTAKVDRRQFLEDFQQGIIFGCHLFDHRQQTRGRHSFIADDEEGKGYFIEEKPRSTRHLVCDKNDT